MVPKLIGVHLILLDFFKHQLMSSSLYWRKALLVKVNKFQSVSLYLNTWIKIQISATQNPRQTYLISYSIEVFWPSVENLLDISDRQMRHRKGVQNSFISHPLLFSLQRYKTLQNLHNVSFKLIVN